MKAIRFAALLLLAAIPSLGCQAPIGHTTTGWRFEVGRPATMSTAAAINQGPGALAVLPLGAVATASPARQGFLAAEAPAAVAGGESCNPCQPAAAAIRRGTLAATAPSCDLNEVCARLEQLERRMSASAPAAPVPPMPRSLPMGPASEQHP